MAESIAAAKPARDDRPPRPDRGLSPARARAQLRAASSRPPRSGSGRCTTRPTRWVAEDPDQNQARDLLASALRKLARPPQVRRDSRRGPARRTNVRSRSAGARRGRARQSEPFQRPTWPSRWTTWPVSRNCRVGPSEARELFGQAEQLFARLVAARSREPGIADRPPAYPVQARAMLDLEESRYKEARATLIRDPRRLPGRSVATDAWRASAGRSPTTLAGDADRASAQTGLRKSG